MRKSLFWFLVAEIHCRCSARRCVCGGGGTANAEGRLKVGGTGDTPPVYFKDAQSVLIGFEVDVLREIGRRIGKDMEFTAIDWPRKTEILNSGTIDVIASALSITDECKVSYSITQLIINNDSNSSLWRLCGKEKYKFIKWVMCSG